MPRELNKKSNSLICAESRREREYDPTEGLAVAI